MTGSAARIRDARPTAGVSSWPHDADHSPELSIGRVVEELAEEFPAISLSKVRYLESEGLVNPARTGRLPQVLRRRRGASSLRPG